MLQVQARESRDAMHRRRKPDGARDICIAATCGDAGRRLKGEGFAADVTCKPGPPASREHAFLSKTRHALEPRQRDRVGATLLGQIEIGNDDDEFAHEGVF